MRLLVGYLAMLLAAPGASLAEPQSAYTELDADKTCTIVKQAPEGEGDWADLRCAGWHDYPVHLSYGDARESVFYGFAPDGGDRPWESFDGFNTVRPTIEWRLDIADGELRPFATIHRWSVSSFGGDERSTEVLVVERVGQPADRTGCRVGIVLATGNPEANLQARGIADRSARAFRCGVDTPVLLPGRSALPPF